ncbi:MAG: hypothetical protein LKE96_10750 [Acetobacter peroxydans]|nr:hypothetical protein [Acetobacter peroxydans]
MSRRKSLASSAPDGTWSLSAYADPTSPAIGSASFSVQDFVPQTLEVALTTEAKTFPATGALDVQLDGRYLYGAPAGRATGAKAGSRSLPTPRLCRA